MNQEKTETKIEKFTSMVSSHPYILMGIIAVLVVIILYLYFKSNGGLGKLGMGGNKKGKKPIKKVTDDDCDDEGKLDELIDSINTKQKDV